MPMHPYWQAALEETAVDGEGSLDLRQEQAQAALSKSVIAPLPEQGVIHVSGSDAAGFLHAQLSNSIEDLETGASRLAAWCSPKGRTLALFRVIAAGDGFVILLDRSLVGNTLKRLKLFVLRSDVVLTDRSDDWAAFGVAGDSIADILAATLGAPPGSAENTCWHGDLGTLAFPGRHPRYLVIGPAAAVIEQWRTLSQHLTPVDSDAWQLLDIRDARPTVTAATSDAFVPQMLNLEPLGGLSFTKGCYPGQEVVARLHYRGQLKRRVYRLQLPVTQPPAPGEELDDGAGVILNAAIDGKGVEALAVIGVETAAGTGLSYRGQPASLADLPYRQPES